MATFMSLEGYTKEGEQHDVENESILMYVRIGHSVLKNVKTLTTVTVTFIFLTLFRI